MELKNPSHHVFVDFENIQAIDLGAIGERSVEVTLLLGKTQKRLEVGLVQQIRQHAAQVRLIEMNASGRNALDFALAYYLGMAAANDPASSFHIISRDKDFDPLIAHLRRANLNISRHDAFSIQAILAEGKPGAAAAKPVAAVEKPVVAADKVAITANRLKRSTTNRPARKSTLLSHIKAQFQGQLADNEAGEIVDALAGRGIIGIDAKGKVSYPGF